MTAKTISRKRYDPKCYDLAASFLSDEPRLDTEAHRDELAQAIQSAIEDFIEFEQSRLEHAKPRHSGKAF